jgi:hypothetical protein
LWNTFGLFRGRRGSAGVVNNNNNNSNQIDGGEVCRSVLFTNETIYMMIAGHINQAMTWAALSAFREHCTPSALEEVCSRK